MPCLARQGALAESGGIPVPSGSFRRSTGLTAGKICSNRGEKGQERWIRAISAWARALSRLGAGGNRGNRSASELQWGSP